MFLHFLRIGSAILALLIATPFTTSPAFSDGSSMESSSNSTKSKTISQSRFLKLGKDQYIVGLNTRMIIDGFSKSMSSWVFSMAMEDRTATRRLFRDMQKLKSEKDRKKRLLIEKQRIDKLIKNLKASLKRLKDVKGEGADEAYKAEFWRLSSAKQYLKRLKVWIKYPMEGTR